MFQGGTICKYISVCIIYLYIYVCVCLSIYSCTYSFSVYIYMYVHIIAIAPSLSLAFSVIFFSVSLCRILSFSLSPWLRVHWGTASRPRCMGMRVAHNGFSPRLHPYLRHMQGCYRKHDLETSAHSWTAPRRWTAMLLQDPEMQVSRSCETWSRIWKI